MSNDVMRYLRPVTPEVSGREAELALLAREHQEAKASGTARFVFVRGPRGVGKTHLLAQLAQSLSSQGTPIFEGGSGREARQTWGVFAPMLGELLTLLLVLAALVFVATLLALRYMPLRLALTPRATKARRVRRRAIELFRTAAERRTVGRTGILIYLSLGEHRAEIIGDEAIARVAPPESWADEMEALLAEARQGRYVDGIVAAVAKVGAVLAEHFPKSRGNPNEIPDKLIEL